MDNPVSVEKCTVQVKLELGHRVQLRKKVTTEGFTHDWMVFVRGSEQCDIQHFVEKVVFRLPESFPKPKRVCKRPPYKVEECGYTGFTIPIEIYFRNKEDPKESCFTYDLFFNMKGNPLVNHLRCEKLTFSNPSKEFRQKLLKAGGVIVLPEDVATGSRQNPDYLKLPTILQSTSSAPKEIKPSHRFMGIKQESIEAPKPHKVTEEQRETPQTERNISSKDVAHKQCKPSKDSSQKLIENTPPMEGKATTEVSFEETKLALKENKPASFPTEEELPSQQESKSSSKRPLTVESPMPTAKQLKKSNSKGLESFSATSQCFASSAD